MTSAKTVVATFAFTRNLAWDDNSSDELSFELQRRTPCSTGTYAAIAPSLPVNTTTFADTTALQSTQYQYRVRAANGAGASAFSNEVCTP